jgi:hypothetical protein
MGRIIGHQPVTNVDELRRSSGVVGNGHGRGARVRDAALRHYEVDGKPTDVAPERS